MHFIDPGHFQSWLSADLEKVVIPAGFTLAGTLATLTVTHFRERNRERTLSRALVDEKARAEYWKTVLETVDGSRFHGEFRGLRATALSHIADSARRVAILFPVRDRDPFLEMRAGLSKVRQLLFLYRPKMATAWIPRILFYAVVYSGIRFYWITVQLRSFPAGYQAPAFVNYSVGLVLGFLVPASWVTSRMCDVAVIGQEPGPERDTLAT